MIGSILGIYVLVAVLFWLWFSGLPKVEGYTDREHVVNDIKASVLWPFSIVIVFIALMR